MDDGDLKALARAVQDGDDQSFKILVDSLTRTLVAMAYRFTGDWEWARDITQETWIKIHRRMGQWDPHRSFSAWLHSIHRNGCLDHLRRAWVRYETTPGEEIMARIAGMAVENPEADMEKREFHERLMTAMGGLSESQRQVFLRVDVEQGDQKTVAEALGIRFNTLRTTLHFARRRVAEALREMEKSL